jgi:transposase
MPEPRLPMRKVRDVPRLSASGMSKRKIAASLGMSATAARDCIWRARRGDEARMTRVLRSARARISWLFSAKSS